MARLGDAASPLFAELRNVNSCQPLLLEEKLIGYSVINRNYLTNSIHLTKNDEFPFIMKHVQFHVKLAYVMTFQRVLGQSLDKCRILLSRNVWTHGQLYVAMSGCGAMSPINAK